MPAVVKRQLDPQVLNKQRENVAKTHKTTPFLQKMWLHSQWAEGALDYWDADFCLSVGPALGTFVPAARADLGVCTGACQKQAYLLGASSNTKLHLDPHRESEIFIIYLSEEKQTSALEET